MALNWIEMKQVEKLVVAHGEELKEHINKNKYLNTAFNTLNVNLDASDFSKNKSIEKANEPEMTL